MILCAAFHRAFPSQLSLCTGAQLLSEVWSAPHAPGPRRPPGQQQPLPSAGGARSRRPAEPLQLGPAAGPGSQRREPPWDTTAGPLGHRTPWGPAGAPEMPRGGQCGRVLCRSCKALASPLKRNRQPRTLIPSWHRYGPAPRDRTPPRGVAGPQHESPRGSLLLGWTRRRPRARRARSSRGAASGASSDTQRRAAAVGNSPSLTPIMVWITEQLSLRAAV